MDDRLALFDPEIEVLLDEVAADPDSYLLRIPRSPRAHRAYELHAGLSLRTAGLRPAERHLLSHFRAELAEFFRQVLYMHVAASEALQATVTRSHPLNHEVSTPTASRLQSRGRILGRLVRPTSCSPRITQAIGSFSSTCTVSAATLVELATLSLACRPSDESRLCLGVVTYLAGNKRRARDVFRAVIVRSPDRWVRAFALHNYGWLERHSHNLIATVELDSEAIAESGTWIVPHIDRFVALLELGVERLVREQGQELEQRGFDAARAFDLHVLGLQRRIKHGRWQISASLRQRAFGLMDKVGAHSRRLLGVFVD